MRHHLALAACIALGGSTIAHAAPKHRAEADDEAADEDDDEESEAPRKRAARRVTADEEVDDAEAPARVTQATRTRAKAWNVAIGPYLWAASVNADVSIGGASVSSGVDFIDLQQHAKYGVPVLAEARYGRFSLYGDMMYGVVGINGGTTVGPLMVGVDATVSSLMVDSAAGYLIAGGEQALLSLEARAGLRYQRTSIDGTVDLSGAPVANPAYVQAAADALVGGQVTLRPAKAFMLASTFDVGVFGDDATWSLAGDASLRIGSRVLLSLGWKTMTTERPNVSIQMHGPRAALQLLF